MNRENEGPPPTPAPAPAPLLSAPAPSGVAMFAVPPSMSVQVCVLIYLIFFKYFIF